MSCKIDVCVGRARDDVGWGTNPGKVQVALVNIISRLCSHDECLEDHILNQCIIKWKGIAVNETESYSLSGIDTQYPKISIYDDT